LLPLTVICRQRRARRASDDVVQSRATIGSPANRRSISGHAATGDYPVAVTQTWTP